MGKPPDHEWYKFVKVNKSLKIAFWRSTESGPNDLKRGKHFVLCESVTKAVIDAYFLSDRLAFAVQFSSFLTRLSYVLYQNQSDSYVFY